MTADPGYLQLYESGELTRRAEAAREMLADCAVCPRRCHVNRLEGELGVCRTGAAAKVGSFSPHFGEEDPLVGRNGSGTIFFAHCNLLCVFCQNADLSHGGAGREVDAGQLARIMIELQRQGCHNINLVTPSHVSPQVLAALPLAVENGLRAPLVYNCGGYDQVETLKLLDGVVDIYMPDFKFWEPAPMIAYCDVEDYKDRAVEALKEMHRQAGDLVVDEDGVAVRGLLVRHLVMPGRLDDARRVYRFLAREISPDTYINVMGQYRPCHRAGDFPELNRALNREELAEAQRIAREEGLNRLDHRQRLLFRLV